MWLSLQLLKFLLATFVPDVNISTIVRLDALCGCLSFGWIHSAVRNETPCRRACRQNKQAELDFFLKSPDYLRTKPLPYDNGYGVNGISRAEYSLRSRVRE
jgi:hypothetical protein